MLLRLNFRSIQDDENVYLALAGDILAQINIADPGVYADVNTQATVDLDKNDDGQSFNLGLGAAHGVNLEDGLDVASDIDAAAAIQIDENSGIHLDVDSDNRLALNDDTLVLDSNIAADAAVQIDDDTYIGVKADADNYIKLDDNKLYVDSHVDADVGVQVDEDTKFGVKADVDSELKLDDDKLYLDTTAGARANVQVDKDTAIKGGLGANLGAKQNDKRAIINPLLEINNLQNDDIQATNSAASRRTAFGVIAGAMVVAACFF